MLKRVQVVSSNILRLRLDPTFSEFARCNIHDSVHVVQEIKTSCDVKLAKLTKRNEGKKGREGAERRIKIVGIVSCEFRSVLQSSSYSMIKLLQRCGYPSGGIQIKDSVRYADARLLSILSENTVSHG